MQRFIFKLILVISFCTFAKASELSLTQALHAMPGNALYSPVSVAGALSLMQAGARGETAAEFSRFFQKNRVFKYCCKAELANFAGTAADCSLICAHAVWVDAHYGVLPVYEQALKVAFDATVQRLDFAQPALICQRVNAWVDQCTHHMIAQLLTPAHLANFAQLIVTNAVYFKGMWPLPFAVEQTKIEDFFVDEQQRMRVSMMHSRDTYAYADFGSAHVVWLPYAGQQLGMLVAVPKRTIRECEPSFLQGLDFLASSPGWFSLCGFKKRVVDLALPRFTIQASYDSLRSLLQKAGFRTAFTAGADFSGISGRPDLYVSEVVHKAVIEVTEQGTRAAAATAGIINTMCFREQLPVTVRADRPFLFAVIHKDSGTVLFVGRLVTPV